MTDVVQKDAFILIVKAAFGLINIVLKDDAAPVSGRSDGGNPCRVCSDGLVKPGSENHFVARSTQHLKGTCGTINPGR